jgi:hypothetical protein
MNEDLGKQCGLCVYFRKKTSIKAKSCKEQGYIETSLACPEWELDDKNLPKTVRQLMYLLPSLTLLQIDILLAVAKHKPVDFIAEGITKTCSQCWKYKKKLNGDEKSCKQKGKKPTSKCSEWELDFSKAPCILKEAHSALSGISPKGPWDLVAWLFQTAKRQFGMEYALGEKLGFVYQRPTDKRKFFVHGNIVDISESNLLMRTKNGRYFLILKRNAIKYAKWNKYRQRRKVGITGS